METKICTKHKCKVLLKTTKKKQDWLMLGNYQEKRKERISISKVTGLGSLTAAFSNEERGRQVGLRHLEVCGQEQWCEYPFCFPNLNSLTIIPLKTTLYPPQERILIGLYFEGVDHVKRESIIQCPHWMPFSLHPAYHLFCIDQGSLGVCNVVLESDTLRRQGWTY